MVTTRNDREVGLPLVREGGQYKQISIFWFLWLLLASVFVEMLIHYLGHVLCTGGTMAQFMIRLIWQWAMCYVPAPVRSFLESS